MQVIAAQFLVGDGDALVLEVADLLVDQDGEVLSRVGNRWLSLLQPELRIEPLSSEVRRVSTGARARIKLDQAARVQPEDLDYGIALELVLALRRVCIRGQELEGSVEHLVFIG